MKRWVLMSGLVLAVACSALGQSACPAGALASDSEVVTGVFGTVAIEACVTRADGQDTYTYRLTHLGGGPENPCGLLISGIGLMATVSTTAPTGWTASTTLSDCGAWWTWSSSVLGSASGSSLIGRTLTMSVSLEGETVPTDVIAAVSLCGKAPIPFRILGPSSSTATTAFVGDGQRITVLGSADTQTIVECEPSWIRHGFTGASLDPDSAVFHLFVDGTEIALNRQVLCVPSYEVGVETTEVYYYYQFPSEYFSIGAHVVAGLWEASEIAAPPTGYAYERTITLLVEECAPEPIPLPDLRVQIETGECECAWTLKQEYLCTGTIKIAVTNLGKASAPSCGLIVTSGQDRSLLSIPELAPNETYRRDVEIVLDRITYGKEPCPRTVTATVDFGSQIEELDEQNNSVDYEVCCQ
ncbi:hypothetical protein IH601_11050 [Candidatus Bipolaricaulota bacterium]|nr:hypothetical protein [Candidatus Bipolaricaulota bacterium]TFH08245.1 MAG: hypothetical protein E4H08_08125 [Candidatus Atribacteria bacterium]